MARGLCALCGFELKPLLKALASMQAPAQDLPHCCPIVQRLTSSSCPALAAHHSTLALLPHVHMHTHHTHTHHKYAHRLICTEDKDYFKTMLFEMLKSKFGVREDYDSLFAPGKEIMFGGSCRTGVGLLTVKQWLSGVAAPCSLACLLGPSIESSCACLGVIDLI